MIDADGHVLEPASLWTDYIEQKYAGREIRFRTNPDGLEYIEIDGAPFDRVRPGTPALLASTPENRDTRGQRYADVRPFGASDPHERLDWMDTHQVTHSLLYPTVGIAWESGVSDPELSQALTRAYNRWIVDFCRSSGGRLVPIAHISLADPDLAREELIRAVDDGCKGAFVAPFTWTRVEHGAPLYDTVWQTAQDLDVPIAVHPTWEPQFANTFGRFEGLSSSVDFTRPYLAQTSALALSHHKQEQAFLSFFRWGTLDRFPRLKLGVLESGGGWIGSFLDRVDGVFADLPTPTGDPRKSSPSEQFTRQCFVSCDVGETAAPLLIEHMGPGNFVMATDYPHPDHSPEWRSELDVFLAKLDAHATVAVESGNLRTLYALSGGAV